MGKYQLIDRFNEVIDINPKRKILPYFLFGLLWYLLACLRTYYLMKWEREGGLYTFISIDGLVYEVFGSLGIFFAYVIIGSIFVYISYKKFRSHNKLVQQNRLYYTDKVNELFEIAVNCEKDCNLTVASKIYRCILQEFGNTEVAKKAKQNLTKLENST